VFPGTLQDGTRVDLARYLFTGFRLAGDETGDLVSLAKPEIASDFYPSQRWSKLFDNLRPDSADLLRLGYAPLCLCASLWCRVVSCRVVGIC
jgi:hypothetical protein